MESVDLTTVIAGVRPGGCVQPHLEGFAAELISAGYAVLPIRDYVRAAAHLGRWLDSRSLGIDQLCEATIADFARHKCRCPIVVAARATPSRTIREAGATIRFAPCSRRSRGTVDSIPAEGYLLPFGWFPRLDDSTSRCQGKNN